MQLYVLDRARNALATTALQYNDLHHMELGAGASTYVFTLDKHDQNGVADPAAQYLVSGNLVVLQDDKKVPWAFTIMSVEEKHDTITVTCADVGIELYNKACDAWAETEAHPFEYYFDECTNGTPWQLGINQLSDLSRKLVYTGRDTGLGRLLSVLKGFDDAECKFRVEVSGTMPAKFIVDVYKQIGTVQENVVLDYGNEVNEITRTESRAAFVTALQGVGGVVEQKTDDSTPATTDATAPEVHVDFKDEEYDQDGFYSPKGDPMLYAVTANKQFNPGHESYIENFYDYDTQSASELLNRTLSQLKTLSEPQLTFNVEAKVIDPTLEIGDTVRIVDHSYQPALYLSARVATLERSYSDPSKNTITFTNYAILTADDQLRELQNIVNQLPTNATIGTIVTNVVNAANAEIKQQLTVALTSADGKNTIYYDAKPSTAKENDTAFVKNADGVTEIWRFHNGAWELDIGMATKEQVDQAIAEMDTDVKAVKQQADDAVSAATDAVAKAGFANDAAEQAKTIANGVATQAANALDASQTADTNATTALANANKALTAANGVSTTVDGLQQDVDTINAKWSSLATQTDVDALKGTVEDQATTIGQTVAGLALKADKSTVDTINKTVSTQSASLETLAGQVKLKAESSTVDKLNGSVSALSAQVNTQAGQIDLMASKTDIAGMATQSYVQAQTKIVSDSITSTVSSAVNNISVGATNQTAGTREFSFKYSQNGANTVLTIENFDSTTKMMHVKVPAKTPGHSGFYFALPALTANQKWSISADVKGTGVLAGMYRENSGTVDSNVAITTDWKRYSFSGIIGTNVATGQWCIYFNASTTAVDAYVKLIKTELDSTTSTSWSPAPEDTATVTALTSLTQDVNSIKALATDNAGKYTSLQTTVSGYQTSVTNTLDNVRATQTTLANQYTSLVSDLGNMVRGGDFEDQVAGQASPYWSTAGAIVSTNAANTGTINPSANCLQIAGLVSGNRDVMFNDYFSVKQGKQYTGSFKVRWANVKQNGSVILYAIEYDAGKARTKAIGIVTDSAGGTAGHNWREFSGTYTPSSGAAYIRLDVTYNGALGTSIIWVDDIDFREALATSSQMTQALADINLRVKTNDVINQINISKESILIDGKKVHITGTTTIDNGVIKNAMIADATINGAKIVDASILSAKISNLDGAKIVANSITADKLSADAVLVGLNNGGYGWKFTPEHLGFFQSGATAPSLQLDPEGIVFADVVSMRKLGINYGGPYSVGVDKSYSGIITQMTYGGADFWGVNVEESGGANWNPIMYSRKQMDTFGIFSGLNISAATHFNTIGPMDPDAKAQMKVVRAQVGGRWSTGFMNSNANGGNQGGILFTDDGATYLGRAGKWYNIFDIVNKIGIA